MKTIWIINEYAGSPHNGMEFRHYYLAKHLAKLSYNVIIISASFSHLFIKLPKCNNIISREKIDGVQYFWIKVINYRNSTNKKRVLKWIQFSLKLFLLNLVDIPNPDYILLSPMATFPVVPSYLLSKLKKAKFLIEIKDIWPLSVVELGNYSENNPLVSILRSFELFGIKHANSIISNLPNYGQYLSENGINKEFHYIPNGISLDDTMLNENLSEDIKEMIPQSKFIVAYAGTIGLANGLEYLIEAAKFLQWSNIIIIIIGEGANKKELIKQAGSLNNVLFLPVIPKRQIQSALMNFDVCYIGWRKKKIYQYGISANKIFDYMYAGRPILQSIDSKFNIVEQAHCGICVESENSKAIANGILELYEMPKNELERLGQNGKEYVLKYHTYEVLAKQFKEVLDGLESTAF